MSVSVSHTITQGYKSGAGSATSVSHVITGDTESNTEKTVAGSTTNKLITIAIDVSAILSLMIYSTKAVTIKTNSTSDPDDTLAVPAGGQIIWKSTDLTACPLTVDVTALYVTNAGSTDADVKVYCLLETSS